jgi:thiosulfate/3-mercaptopyruvate sulfurtransferase
MTGATPQGSPVVKRQLKIQGWLVVILALAWIMVWPAGVWTRPQGDYAHPEILLQAEDLKALLDRKDSDLRIIDFRHKAKYYLGHIPGAIQIWRPEIANRDRAAFGMPAPKAQMEKLLGRLGISSKNTIVIYSDQCDHTYLWWMLAYYGFPLDRLKLLDGGFEAWKSKGYPTQLTAPRLKAAAFKLPPEPRQALLATLGDLKAARSAPQSSIILDVRTQEQYRGERTREGAARRGHIPGAVEIYYKEARIEEGPAKGGWKSAAEIRSLYTGRGVTPDKDIYIYGHTDLCAAYTLVSLYLADYPLEKLHVYGGSWIEWSQTQEPVASGPAGPAK